MLVELHIRDLGVIEDVSLVLGPGMTALTGETGAGKTMLVEAIELLVGGRADTLVVRAGAEEAVVEGRFVDEASDEETVISRIVPRNGRSRAYVNGRLAPASTLTELGAGLVDLHGQHAHQSLLATTAQRNALDRFGAVDLGPLRDARRQLHDIEAQLAGLGGDERARAREIDLLRFQVDELDAASLDSPDEDSTLAAEEDALADAVAHQEAAATATAALVEDDGARDVVGAALAAIAGRAPFAELETRLRGLAAELDDVAAEVRAVGESIEDDPERLAAVRDRRQLLHDLRRKYGETLAEVIAYAATTRSQLDELLDHDRRAAELDSARSAAAAAVDAAAKAVAKARRAAAPSLAAAVQEHLVELAMPKAVVDVAVGEEAPGDDVAFLLAANPGSAPAPLAKVASGGELARAMLAVRLVLLASEEAGSSPPTLVFDEVDAGIGGTAALVVGRALAALADGGAGGRQVLVVTHLAQVAACADTQVVVAKADDGEVTTSKVAVVKGDDRLVELARMLSGSPDSAASKKAAKELLATARQP